MAIEMDRAKQIAEAFLIRSSATIEIMAEMGLTEKQEVELDMLNNRYHDLLGNPLTDTQKKKRLELIEKSKNKELPEGAKTHCKKWLKEYLYNRREELKAKQVRKGNDTEEDGFTLACVQLNLGMVKKNKERKSNKWMIGECDLFLERLNSVYDNKSSWSLDSFPMFETEFDKRYWWQLQSYGCIWDAQNLVLCFTLNDDTYEAVEKAVKWESDHNEKYKIAERMVFTPEFWEVCKSSLFPDATLETFTPIPDSERIKSFTFKRDDKAIEKIKDRVLLCREYIYKLLTQKQSC